MAKRKFTHVRFKNCEDRQFMGRTGIIVVGPSKTCDHAGYNTTLVMDPVATDLGPGNQQNYGWSEYTFWKQEEFTGKQWQKRLIVEANFEQDLEVIGEIELELT